MMILNSEETKIFKILELLFCKEIPNFLVITLTLHIYYSSVKFFFKSKYKICFFQKLDKKLRENLRDARNSLFTGDTLGAGQFRYYVS